MPSSGTLRSVTLVITDVSVEHIASIIIVTRIGDVAKMLSVTSLIHSTLKMEAIRSSETSVFITAIME
jgi:hypothetical protein